MAIVLVLLSAQAAAQGQARSYAPYGEYEMAKSAEIALARSAAPERISSRATIKVLTRNGFEVAAQGDNGFTCIVMRSWSAAPDEETSYYAKVRSPICFDQNASRSILPIEELRTRLGLGGKSPGEIAREVSVQYGNGQLPQLDGVSFGYMWSASSDTGPGFGAWHPHMMIFAPYYENSALGGGEIGNHSAPFVVGGGSPFSIVIVPVDDGLAIKAKE
jgi:hypothetical protein